MAAPCDKLGDVNDATPPPKKVVKRVVKKTVVRPASMQPTTPKASAPRVAVPRPGRPTTTVERPAAPPATQPEKRERRGIAVGSGLSRVGGAVRSAATRVGHLLRDGAYRVGDAAADAFAIVRTWRIPRVEPLRAALITGAVCGIVATGLGFGATALFSWIRGVSTGGGHWGTLTFVVLTFVAFALGEYLLTAFGSQSARVTSFLGVTLTIVLILAFLLKPADGIWALVVIPVTSALSFLGAQRLMSLAENEAATED